MYGNAFMNRKGTEQVGAINMEGINVDAFRREKPIGDLEKFKDVPIKFETVSANTLSFVGIGKQRLPTPNRLKHEGGLFGGTTKFSAQTAYGESFINANTDGSRELFNLER